MSTEERLKKVEAALRKIKSLMVGAEDTQACTELIMVVDILKQKYATKHPAQTGHSD